MEYGVSSNDETPIELGKWVSVLGEAEPWISPTDQTTGCILWKQAVEAKRSPGDKYGAFHVHPQHGAGSITVGGMQTTGFKGDIDGGRKRSKQYGDVSQLHITGVFETEPRVGTLTFTKPISATIWLGDDRPNTLIFDVRVVCRERSNLALLRFPCSSELFGVKEHWQQNSAAWRNCLADQGATGMAKTVWVSKYCWRGPNPSQR
jgi:hypothetical protein